MCGIIGVVQLSAAIPELRQVDLWRMKHRGPDGSGIHAEPHAVLGHTRLSIIDLSQASRQPMSCPNGRYHIAFNGEIYNYIELREELMQKGHLFTSAGDTEVILSSYVEWGRECVKKFRGMFAIAIWDSREKTLFLSRDRFGERPLLYAIDEGRFVFASEMRSIIPLMATKPRLNEEVAAQYLHFQFCPEPASIIQGVGKFPAGHHLTIAAKDLPSVPLPESYWNLEDAEKQEGGGCSEYEAGRLIRDGLENAIGMVLRADVPVGIALSGGIDSGAIAALAQRQYHEPMHAFSVGYPGRPPWDERQKAKQLAKSLGMHFHEVEIPTESFVGELPALAGLMDEPIADPAAFGHLMVPRAVHASGIKVLLSGIGGDELFWGYEWTKCAVRLNLLFKNGLVPDGIRRMVNSRFAGWCIGFGGRRRMPASVRSLACLLDQLGASPPPVGHRPFYGLHPDVRRAESILARLGGERLRGISRRSVFGPFDIGLCAERQVPNAVLRTLCHTWLVSNCLTLSDRVGMSVGVETRLPFLDHKLAELAMKLRSGAGDHFLPQKSRLKNALQGVLPKEVLRLPKRGFEPPVQEWIQGAIDAYGHDIDRGISANSGMMDGPKMLSLVQSNNILPDQRFLLYKVMLLDLWWKQVST